MTITRVEPFILHVPVTRNEIADSTHVVSHWGMPGVRLHTDDGRIGFGDLIEILSAWGSCD